MDPATAPPDEIDEPFVHLHTHTEYSLLDGAARITELVAETKRLGQPAVAITDHGVLYGAVEFQAAARAAGVKPIVGCEMYMAPRSHTDKEGKADRDPNHLVLLAQNEVGYRNLVRLVSIAQLDGYYYKPRIDRQLLAQYSEGLVCLSACIGGELPQAILRGDMQAAEAVAREHLEIFGRDRYFLEVQDHGIPEETVIRDGLREIARRTDIPFVCTNDSHYIRAEDADAHDILLCLQTGARRVDEKRFKFHGPEFYVAGGREMRERFAAFGEAASNTLAVAAACTFEMQFGEYLLPAYEPIPAGLDADEYLRELCERGLVERYGPSPTAEARERLAMELDVIRETGFAAYFLIVQDFVRAARCRDVKVGPGRGSAAGSLVAYVLGITNVCPLQYHLLFERFLNRERVSMPDIDIDFDDRRRDRVIDYVQQKYGRERVAQIITFGTMAARASIRDVGRVLDVPLSDVDRLAKLVPAQVGITLEEAVKTKEMRELLDQEEWARTVIDAARRLEGISRNASTHAAGVVIAPRPLRDIVPLQRSTTDRESSMQVTQFDMNGVQKIGLLKMDFLGLTNLSIIEESVDSIERTTGERIDIEAIPLDDPATYQLLGRADTLGVFQFEATGGKKVLMDLQVQSLDELSAANALNRPGPIEGGVIDLYVRRKRGLDPIEYPAGLEELLAPILADTYGIILYQEQVMRIAQAVAGFTLGQADILRSAMGKKDKAKMAQQREKFLAGAATNGISAESAGQLFDLIAFFAGYGFNRSHSICYSLIGYQTAWLKANYPLEYMTALLNSKAGDFDRLKPAILDAHARGLVVKPPDINRSGGGFTVGEVESREILYGLSCIKNVGTRVVEAIIEARETAGPFRSLLDLCLRTNTRDLNRRVLEALVRSGACDALGDRAALLATIDRAIERAQAVRRERESGQTSLFGLALGAAPAVDGGTAPGEVVVEELELVTVPGVSADEYLHWEREHLGMYLSDHPLRRVEETLRQRVDTNVGELGPHLDGLIVQVGGSVREVRTVVPRRSTTGGRMAFLQVEDMSGACEVVVFARGFEEAAHLLRNDAVVVIRGRVEAQRASGTDADEESGGGEALPVKILAESVMALDDPRLLTWRADQTVHVRVPASRASAAAALRRCLDENAGDIPVVLLVEHPDRVDEVSLGADHGVAPSPALERALSDLLGAGAYSVEVRRSKGSVPAWKQRAAQQQQAPAPPVRTSEPAPDPTAVPSPEDWAPVA